MSRIGGVIRIESEGVEGECRVLTAHKEARTLPGASFLMDGDRVVIHWVFEFTRCDSTSFCMDELAHQRWRGDGVVEERFHHDPAQLMRKTAVAPG